MANTLKDKKITVLAIHPGWVKTDMGGENAPIMPGDSAKGIYNLLISVNESNTGKLLDFQGNKLPW
jgi:NAD(P)-dependent dehydrogenase (short-subunit alcohol dehydrogenase family)